METAEPTQSNKKALLFQPLDNVLVALQDFKKNRNVAYIKNALVKKLGNAKPDKYEGSLEQLINELKNEKLAAVKLSGSTENKETNSSRIFNVDRINFPTHQHLAIPRMGFFSNAMKSAGAATKCATASVANVLYYAEYVHENGLNLLCPARNDVDATTGTAGSGENLVIFSTGLGTPTCNPVAPVVETATNSSVAKKLSDLIGFEHRDIINEGKTIEQFGEKLLNRLLKIAGSKRSGKAEQLQQDVLLP